jgi:hypothetical protein
MAAMDRRVHERLVLSVTIRQVTAKGKAEMQNLEELTLTPLLTRSAPFSVGISGRQFEDPRRGASAHGPGCQVVAVERR